MHKIIFTIVILAVLIPSTLHAQEPTIKIEPENRCSPYIRSDYKYSDTVEDNIIARMNGRIYSPYTDEIFISRGKTEIDHMVDISEAHDSGLCSANASTRLAFASDLDNLALASPYLSRIEKSDKDLTKWLPAHNRCWFVAQVIKVKKKYGLSMDANEAATALNVLADCDSFDLIFAYDVPPEIPPEGRVEMTVYQYRRWINEEVQRISVLVPEWDAGLLSEDVDEIFAALLGILDTAFGFYDTHSRIVTHDPSYEETQTNLACYMELLEPFRDLEDATIMDVLTVLTVIGEDFDAYFADCDPESLEELERLLGYSE